MGILERAQAIQREWQALSLDETREDEHGGELALDVADTRPTPEELAGERERRVLVATALRVLNDRERAVIALRFAGWTLADVGLALSVGRQRVQQIEARACATMRTVVQK